MKTLKNLTVGKTRKHKGYRTLRNQDLGNTIYYMCQEGASVGRTFSLLVKTLLKEKPKEAYFVVGGEKLTISGSTDYIVNHYRVRFRAGNRMKGPFYSRIPEVFLKRVIRLMMDYKSKHKDLLKKLCFLSKEAYEKERIKERSSIELPTFKIRPCLFSDKLSIEELLKKV